MSPGIRLLHSRQGNRRGVSLLEVLLALAIFLMAFAALSQLSRTGMNAAVRSRLQTNAIIRCESRLAELAAGIEPLENASDQPFQDDPNWRWSLQIGAGPHPDLLLLNVSTRYVGQNDYASTGYSMSRLIRDPAVWDEAADSSSTTSSGTGTE